MAEKPQERFTIGKQPCQNFLRGDAAIAAPYVPSWCYEDGPRMCQCGHHEGYHNDDGQCLHARRFSKCGCARFTLKE